MTPRRDPVAMMLDIADHFMAQAVAFDARVTAAVEADAAPADIARLMDLSATNRLRSLSACQAAAPFCSPKLQAVEFSPATPLTRSHFEERLERMTENEVTAHLRAIAAGTLTLAAIDADEEDVNAGE